MTWVRYDDRLHSHPKVAAMGYLALPSMGLTLLAATWSSDVGTDGHIPRGQIYRLCGDIEMLLPSGKPWELVNSLVDARVWDECTDHDGCWVVHDFLDYNPSHAEVRALREARAAAGARGGKQAASKRSSKPLAKGQAKSNPVPVPVPLIEVPNGTSHVVFELWRVETKRPLARLTTKRARLLRDRLKDGYDEDYLCDTVRGVARDPWVERPRFNDLTDILKSGESVEKFHDLWVNGPPVMAAKPLTENPVDRRIRESFSHLTHNGDRP